MATAQASKVLNSDPGGDGGFLNKKQLSVTAASLELCDACQAYGRESFESPDGPDESQNTMGNSAFA